MRRLQPRQLTTRDLGVEPRALIWPAVGLLLADAAVLVVTGRELIVTGPETETLGQGAVGFALIFGAFWLAVVALLGLRFPQATGLIVLVIGVLLFVQVARIDYEYYYSGEWYTGEQEWSDYWLAGDRVRDPSGIGGAVIDSRTLSLALFLVPTISAILLLVSGFVASRSLDGERSTEAGSLLLVRIAEKHLRKGEYFLVVETLKRMQRHKVSRGDIESLEAASELAATVIAAPEVQPQIRDDAQEFVEATHAQIAALRATAVADADSAGSAGGNVG